MAAQLPVQQKRQQADFVLDNSGTLEELRSSVAFLAELLRTLPSRIALAKARDAS
jgi:dephospho-CoA kinase